MGAKSRFLFRYVNTIDMQHKNEDYVSLIRKIDTFIRKYYLNQLIRGVLYSAGALLVLFLLFSILEYAFYFERGVRKLMVYSYLGVSFIALGKWVFLPLMHFFRLGSIITHQQAARIVGQHFPTVSDKLLNILQLSEQADKEASTDLLMAGIQQKTQEIRLVPFPKAINLGQNRKYLKYALPPLLILLILLVASPTIITESTTRLIQNNRDFEREAPFSFLVNEDGLEVVQYDNFQLTVQVEGQVLPADMLIEVDDYQYRLKKIDQRTFQYTFNKVQNTTSFQLSASGFESKLYTLNVLPKPNLAGFEVALDFPAYTGRRDERLENIGDLVVPAGTAITWTFQTDHTDKITAQFSEQAEAVELDRISESGFLLSKKAMKDERYTLFISNKDLPVSDSIRYSLSVIPDLNPSITVKKFIDSTAQNLLYFVGDASDDYGLISLSFNFQVTREDGTEEGWQTQKLGTPSGRQLQYDYQWDLNELELKAGDEVSYYFEVFDNDAIHGSKAARTNQMLFKMPTQEEYEQMAADNSDEIKDNLLKAQEESRKIQEELRQLREELLQKKDVDWQTREEMEKLLERQKELQRQLEQAQKNFRENNKNQEQFSDPTPEMEEKQERLEELFEETVDEEMQELMEKIEELLQEMNKEEMLEMMQDFEFNDEEMEKELDRLEELYKQLELEKEMQDQINKLQEMAKKQEELAEKTEQNDGKTDTDAEREQESLQKEQEELTKEFEQVKEKMEEIGEKNEQLENPKDIGDPKEQMEDIQKDMQNSQEQLQKKENKKAAKSQKNAAQQMQEMADQMSSSMQAGEMEQMQEDMQALRQLLENLVAMSFDQEDLIDEFGITNVFTPRYTALVEQQFKLQDTFRMIEDSLQALAKRVIQMESFVTDKVSEINKNLRKSVDELEERKKPEASAYQQFTMKYVNDLALMLSETMSQMQQQMSSMMSGAQMCNNPGGQGKEGKMPMEKITEGQQQLGEKMQKMQSGKKPGEEGTPSSRELAEMAARQAALRKALEEARQKKMMNGEDARALQEIIEQMDQNEIDLVNKQLNSQLFQRQQEILTRLLEAEKAEREKGLDDKRKSETASQVERELPPSLEEYLKQREAEIELYRQASPDLKPYYKFLVDEYFKNLRSGETAPSGPDS